MKFSNCLIRNALWSSLLAILATSCWDTRSNEPLVTNIKGRWRWTKTFDQDYRQLDAATSDRSAHLQVRYMPSGSEFFDVVEFYEDNVKVDSLFMLNTDKYGSSITHEKDNEIFVNYVDGQKKPAVVRFKFFFNGKKSSATRMEINVQKNTSNYRPEADTVIVEYLRDPM